MLRSARRNVVESVSALGDVFGNPALRRIELARAVVTIGSSGASIVFVVLAYRAGGASAVAFLFVVRTLLLVFAAPLGAIIGDRFRRQRVMAVADAARAVVLAASAVVAAGDPSVGVLVGLGGAIVVFGTLSGPARSALIPEAARTPEELAAANVVSNTIQDVVSVVGPALAGMALALGGSATALAAAAAASASSALLVLGIETAGSAGRATGRAPGLFSRASLAGLAFLAADRPTRLVTALYCAQTLVGGVVGVLLVAVAADLLRLGGSGVGYLYAALGIGGILGAALALTFGDARLGTRIAAGAVLSAGPLALMAAWPEPAAAFVFLALVGVGDSVVDIAGLTFLQRRIPNEILARVGGVISSFLLIFASIGNLLAPLLVATLGLRATVICAAAAIPVTAPVWWRAFARLDAAAPAALPTLRSVPFLAALSSAALEELARAAIRVRIAAGQTVFHQGDRGDRFYVVVDGMLEIVSDGRLLSTATAGDYFGEIALLRDTPRTATVAAVQDADLFALEREDLLRAVMADAASRGAASELVESRLTRAIPAGR